MLLRVLQKQNVLDFTTLKRVIKEACALLKIQPSDGEILRALT